MTTKQNEKPKGVIAYLVARAMGLEDSCAVKLTSGERVAGPFVTLRVDQQIRPTKTNSTLITETRDGREIRINDIADVTLADGSPLPTKPNLSSGESAHLGGRRVVGRSWKR